jgi:N-methylhydantoinase A/oxoprolinase/acetone carboxylase beta subunit
LKKIWVGIDTGGTFTDLMEEYRIHYNGSRVHQSLSGSTPAEYSGEPPPAHAALDYYGWQQHCRGVYQTPIAA